MSTSYRIHPAIGVARVGGSLQGWFRGPETPGQQPDLGDPAVSVPPNGKYKDGPGSIKRQAAGFRVYEYDVAADGRARATREITSAEATITWQVTLGNRKAAGPRIFEKGDRNTGVARERLIIEATATIQGENTAPAPLAGTFQGRHTHAQPVPLGELRTDGRGRVLVLGGYGRSFSPTGAGLTSTFNNDDWCDDTSDGPVTAVIRFHGTARDITVDTPAWVIVGPPDFAPPVGNVISLYDIVYETVYAKFHEFHHDPGLAAGPPSFTRHIYPILQRTVATYWVDETAFGHQPGAGGDFLQPAMLARLSDSNPDPGSPASLARNRIFARLRRPDGSGGDMPRLQPEFDSGRRPRLTSVQYTVMESWAKGQFLADWTGERPPLSLDAVAIADHPFQLDKAALDACVGASFYPGIEAPRIMRDQPSTFAAPFRIDTRLPAGTVTQGLALPWQTDFFACATGWWPAQRPVRVRRGNGWGTWDEGVVRPAEDWALLGFVVRGATATVPYVESERDL